MRRAGGWPARLPYGQFRLNVDSPLARGLVFWAPLIDSSPNDRIVGLAATPTNGPSIGNSSEGLGWLFDRPTSHYLVTASTPITTTPCTLACWFNPAASSTRDMLTIANSGNTTDFFQLQQASALGVRARSGDSGGTSNATSTNTVAISVWQHAVGVFLSSTSRSAYLNGTGKATSTGARTPSGCNNIGIAATVSSSILSTSYYGGYIRHAMIWNRALSDAEVWLLYQLSSRMDFLDAAMWNGANADAPVVSTTITRPVRPVIQRGLPIRQLRI